ncbi:MAG: EAL domain-containing protein [Pseudomonadota bacterium]|nr:EAL domain-containing protein [Pseudomonadota bacterium]MDP1903064.1 EAL domain-containing protein [Pseudomonadota bacterium]MDP2353053.1 EAL domain-containing protein [Pseudomonadota bacterium]
MSVTLQQILNAAVQTVEAATTLAEVWRRMEELRISCVVVLEGRRPLGIFTERDSVGLVARGGWREDAAIGEYMREPLLAGNPGMDIHRAYQLMAARNERYLLLVDDAGDMLGLVTEGDLLHSIGMEHLVQPRTVATAMTVKVVTLGEDDSLLDAARAMADRVLSCLVVVRDGRPVGILSERDIVRLSRHGGDPAQARLGVVMSRPLLTIQAEDLLALAMHRMEQSGIRRLVVVDTAGLLIGLLTRHDLVKALQEHYVELLQATIDRLEEDLTVTRDHLKSVEHRLLERSVMSQVNDAVFVVDLDGGRVVEANEQAGDLLGYSQAETLGLHCHGFAELCGGAENWPAWAASFARRGIQTEETRLCRKSGEWFPAEVSLRHVRDSGHDFLVAVVRDISQRKHDEARIRLDREQQRALREILEIGIGDGGLRERLEACLDRLLAVSWLTLLPKGGIFIMEAGGLRLRAQRNFSPEIQASCARVALGHCLCGRVAASGRTEYAHCVDHRHEITYPGMADHGHYSLPLAAAGEILGVLVLYLPVGHPRITEEQEFLEAVGEALAGVLRRDRAEQAVTSKEAEIRLLLDSTAEAIFGVDMDLRCTFANRACLEMLGYGTVEELLGRRIHELIHYAHADGRPYPEHECPALPGEGLREKRHVENEVFWRKDGTPLPVEYWSHPVVREDRLVGAVVTFVDVSERKAAEDKLRLAAKVFDSTLEGVMVTDAETRILFVNRACTTITGYSESDLVGQSPKVLSSGRHDDPFYREIWRVINEEGGWQGEIWNRTKTGEEYPEWLSISAVHDDAGRVVNYVGVFADISQIKRSEAQLEHLAHHDPLTTLPNRTLFQSRLAHAINVSQRHGSGLGLLFMDLDGFKNINDSLGHPAGDELLQAIARRLSDNLRTVDTLARLGGDEFVVLLEDLESPSEAAVVAHNLLTLLRQPFHLSDGREVFSGASIGISLFPDDAADATHLVRNADAALYQAKSQGRDTYRFYTEALTRVANERLQLESRLRGALERGEFILHYQPQISTRDGSLLGAEALLRWLTPEGELVPPARFIPLAEETGLIRPLGEWVMREACTQFRAWFDAGLPPISLAVNLSSRQIEQRDLVERLQAILEESGFPAHLLELELTESAIMAQGEQAPAVLAAIKQLGVSLAIDDFGTGYSSLAYLKRFAVDKLKIDRGFIRDIPDDVNDVEIAATIIAMGKNLKLKVLAEGVETEAQLAFLQLHDCDAWQGYHFSKPLPAADFLQLWQRLRRT